MYLADAGVNKGGQIVELDGEEAAAHHATMSTKPSARAPDVDGIHESLRNFSLGNQAKVANSNHHLRNGSLSSMGAMKTMGHSPKKDARHQSAVQMQPQGKDQALARIMTGQDSMVSMLMKEMVMLKNSQGTHITERVIR